MPMSGGPVYQPTTTVVADYNCVDSGNGNGNGGQHSAMNGGHFPMPIFRKRHPQVAFLLFALLSLTAGIAMLASAITDWLETTNDLAQQNKENADEEDIKELNLNGDIPLFILCGGILMTTIGIVCLCIYLKVADWRDSCAGLFGLFNKKPTLTRQMQGTNSGEGNGQGITALNPSTDPLVAHNQYAAVCDMPSFRPEDEERRNLMPDSNKDCFSSAEESDRMLEPDPRILLRPMKRAEDI